MKKFVFTKLNVIFKTIWLAIAILFYLAGMIYFFDQGKGFSNWMFWGLFCVIPVIFDFLKNVFGAVKHGAKEGKRNVTIHVENNTAYATNNSFMSAIIFLALEGVFNVFIGPVYLGIKILITLFNVIKGYIKISKKEI